MYKVILIFLSSSFSLCLTAQNVTSLTLESPINIDGLYVDGDTIFAAEGWDGSRLYSILPDGSISIVCSDLDGPIDVVRKSNGKFYVSEWNAARIAVLSPTGEIESYISTLPGPGPIVQNEIGQLFVTHNNGDGSGFVSIIDTDDSVTSFFSGYPLNNPGGIDIDSFGNLYIANFNDGNIIKINSEAEASVIGTVPGIGYWKTGHLVMRDFQIFISGISDHYVYLSDTLGNVEILAGSGEDDHLDGSYEIAAFSNPNGIALNAAKNVLYVAKGFDGTNYIQKIDLGTLEIESIKSPEFWSIKSNSPYEYIIEFDLTSNVEILIRDTNGKIVSHHKNAQSPFNLDMSNNNAGAYFITLTDSVLESTKKIIRL